MKKLGNYPYLSYAGDAILVMNYHPPPPPPPPPRPPPLPLALCIVQYHLSVCWVVVVLEGGSLVQCVEF